MSTITVIVNGKPEQREVDHVEMDDFRIGIGRGSTHTFPREVPVLRVGERALYTVSGEVVIVREFVE